MPFRPRDSREDQAPCRGAVRFLRGSHKPLTGPADPATDTQAPRLPDPDDHFASNPASQERPDPPVVIPRLSPSARLRFWSCPSCERAQSVRFWAATDSARLGLARSAARQVPLCVMPFADPRRSSGDTSGGLGVLRLCTSACCGRNGVEAARWPGGEAA